MLVKLLSDQIANYWNVIRYAIEQALPPIANEEYNKMNRILESLLNGSMDCWVSVDEENKKIEGVMVTTFSEDYCSGVRNLLVYSVFGYNEISNKSWSEGFETISKWAKHNGCYRIIAYTDVERIKEVVKSLGGEARYTLISIPLRS